MKNIIKFLTSNVGSTFITTINNGIKAWSKTIDFLNILRECKLKKQHTKDLHKKHKKIDDICDKGSIADLFKCVLLLVALCGCTTMYNVEITTTKTWEGHYFTIEDIQKAVYDIKLNKNESIWLMSNTTFKQILKKYQMETNKDEY